MYGKQSIGCLWKAVIPIHCDRHILEQVMRTRKYSKLISKKNTWNKARLFLLGISCLTIYPRSSSVFINPDCSPLISTSSHPALSHFWTWHCFPPPGLKANIYVDNWPHAWLNHEFPTETQHSLKIFLKPALQNDTTIWSDSILENKMYIHPFP